MRVNLLACGSGCQQIHDSVFEKIALGVRLLRAVDPRQAFGAPRNRIDEPIDNFMS